MAYDRIKIFDQAKTEVNTKKLIWIEEIIAFLPCSKPTFYEFFPIDSNELNELKELIELNKIQVKSALRKKWFDSTNPLTQMALYKLIGTEDEYHRIASTKTENKNINENREVPLFPDVSGE